MRPAFRVPVVVRYLLATAVAALSGVLIGTLACPDAIGSPSAPPDAWLSHAFILTFVTMMPAVVAVLPLCIVVRWIMSRRCVHGWRSAAIAGGLMAVPASIAALSFPLTLADPRFPWRALLPHALVFAGFALSWPVCMEWLGAVGHPSPTSADARTGSISESDRAARTALEALSAAAALVPMLVIGFFLSFVISLGAGEEWQLVRVIPSAAGSNRAYVAERNWGGAVGGISTEVYVLPSTRSWTERQRGLLVWSGDHVDSVRVLWDDERTMRVQVRPNKRAWLDDHTQAWSRSGFIVSSDPLP